MKKSHLFLFGSLLAGAGLGHASSANNFISSTVDTVVKVVNTNTSGDGTAISARTNLGNTAAIKASAVSSGSGQWLTGIRGRAENTGGSGVYAVGTYGGSRGAQNYDVSHGVYAEANNAYYENWAVKGVANAEGGQRAVGAYFEGMNGTEYVRGVDAVGSGSNAYQAYGVNALAQDALDYNFGVNSNAYSGYAAYALKGYAANAYNENYGVYGDAYGGYNATGVFGTASGSTNDKAAVFIGDVLVTGTCTCYPSDEKLKKNVRPLDKGLDVVMALKPKAYEMKVDEYKDELALAKGPQVGMIAQEVEKVMPELVRPVHVPPRTVTRDGKARKIEAIDYKSLDYVALVPVLVKAMQEQQAEIESLKARLQ